MSMDDYWRTMRIKLFMEGHTLDELDAMSAAQWQDINAYIVAQEKAAAKRKKK